MLTEAVGEELWITCTFFFELLGREIAECGPYILQDLLLIHM